MNRLIFSISLVFFTIGVFYYVAHIDGSSVITNKNENKFFKKVKTEETIKNYEEGNFRKEDSVIATENALYDRVLKINGENSSSTFKIEIVDTDVKRNTGLSYRKEMCDDCGMFFTFAKEGFYAFWMKDMNFDLDIIFINNENKIVDVFSYVKKEGYNSANPNISERIKNTKGAMHVLELNAGKAKEKNLKVGDILVVE